MFNIYDQGQQAASTFLLMQWFHWIGAPFGLSTPCTKYIVSVLKAALNPQITVRARPRLVHAWTAVLSVLVWAAAVHGGRRMLGGVGLLLPWQ